ncbi:MAG: DNA ligase D, partial [Clostridiaceae bacterium]|nr:DNA ligase D [Clostridiaceae bacterium]
MKEKLSEYNQKRNFERTTEPEGIKVSSDEQLRFVVQHHIASKDHFDFRLEWNGTLLSWAVPKGPSYNPKEKRLAVKVEDHPLDYRNFEGNIPKGEYGGGVVMLWDEGLWEPYGNADEGLNEGVLKFVLNGRRLKGKWALIRLKGKEGESKDNWLLLKEKDEYTKTNTGISEYTTSIRTGRTMTEIEAGKDKRFTKNPFNSAEVQLAELVNTIPEGENWIYEMKYDGYRILAFVEGNSARLITRNGNDYTKRFFTVSNSLIEFANGKTMVLDGEMTIIDAAGKTNFQALQNYMKNPKGQNLTYIVFDLLALDGKDLRGKPLIDRKEILEELMKDAPENLYYSRHIKGSGKESFIAACEAGMEGIIGKKYDSIYSGTRNGDWIKLKCDKRQEFVIGGYTLSDKKTKGISSLLLGVYEGENLVYAGRAGTGFNKRNTEELTRKFSDLIMKKSPFVNPPKARSNEEITWLEPKLAAEIKFAEWTEDNQLRQASFKSLREDKNPKDIKRESSVEGLEKSMESSENSSNIIIGDIKISSPDKVIFEDPEIKKIDVIRYYQKVSEYMLPYVGHRILSIVRCPKGVSQTCFYKKHPGPGTKGVVTIPIFKDEGETEEYFYIENKSGLISEAQMGTLEFHTWGSRIEELEKPDMMVFDLDPDEGMDIEKVRQGVRDIKSILSELSLISYLKTSGGKGYHVVVPINPSVNWDTFHGFARKVAEVMEQKWPDSYTSN